MKVVKFLWIDDMLKWAEAAQDNLKIIARKYDIHLEIFHSKNGEDMNVDFNMQNHNLDCIIMDYHMEPFNGDKYIKDIRNATTLDYEHLSDVPIIFYSQDNSTDLDSLVKGIPNVTTVFRKILKDKIKEMFFEK